MLLLLVAWVANTWFDVPFTIAGFPDSGLSLDAFVARDRRLVALGIITTVDRARRPRLSGRGPDPSDPAFAPRRSRFGTPVYVTSVAGARGRRGELRDAFPDPWLRAFSVKANDVPAIVARLGAAGLGANVVSSRRVGRGTRGRHPERPDHARGHRQDRRGPAGRRPGRGDGDPLRWVAVESPEELDALAAIAGAPGSAAAAGRRSTSSSASTRT